LPHGFKHKGVCALLEGLRAELAIYSLSATTPAAPASSLARTPSTRHGRDQGRYASSLAAITACHGSGWLTRAALVVHPRLAAFLFLLRGAVSSARRAPTNVHFRAVHHARPFSGLAKCDEVAPHPRLLPPRLVARFMGDQDSA
jgi:hypothetical protein